MLIEKKNYIHFIQRSNGPCWPASQLDVQIPSLAAILQQPQPHLPQHPYSLSQFTSYPVTTNPLTHAHMSVTQTCRHTRVHTWANTGTSWHICSSILVHTSVTCTHTWMLAPALNYRRWLLFASIDKLLLQHTGKHMARARAHTHTHTHTHVNSTQTQTQMHVGCCTHIHNSAVAHMK